MSRGRRPLSRVGATIALLVLSAVPTFAGRAAGEEKLADLQARMESIQADLDASAAKVEEAHHQEEELANRSDAIEREMDSLEKKNSKLIARVSERAAELYMAGTGGAMEVLFSSEDFADLSDNAQILSQVTIDDNDVFVELARTQDRLAVLSEELDEKQKELAEAEERLQAEADRLQAQFESISSEYEELKEQLAAQAPAPSAPAAAAAPVSVSTNGKVCPIAGATSFVDSWGDPRSGGRSHEGVDMMAAHGTPQVAIVSGTITYAGYSELGGNVQYLSGDDGNLYVYVHQRENTVTGGHVQAGQVISYVGDTGNAAGNPHLHFEYHP
ncbi:MAG TPA: peptidoglycan DD-metalloendopeptidase family protein, partial [Actinomycetota bacterium]|nr:peptidoglycan DD-metalloendopeptidase family protein [Actinomycetota bacterium]